MMPNPVVGDGDSDPSLRKLSNIHFCDAGKGYGPPRRRAKVNTSPPALSVTLEFSQACGANSIGVGRSLVDSTMGPNGVSAFRLLSSTAPIVIFAREQTHRSKLAYKDRPIRAAWG